MKARITPTMTMAVTRIVSMCVKKPTPMPSLATRPMYFSSSKATSNPSQTILEGDLRSSSTLIRPPPAFRPSATNPLITVRVRSCQLLISQAKKPNSSILRISAAGTF